MVLALGWRTDWQKDGADCRRPRCLESPFRFLSTRPTIRNIIHSPTKRGRRVPVGQTVMPANKPTQAKKRRIGLPSWQSVGDTFSHRVSIQVSNQLSHAEKTTATAGFQKEASFTERSESQQRRLHTRQNPAAADHALLSLTGY